MTIVGDIHLSSRPPSIRTESYASDILAKLEWIVNYANENSDVLLLLGDVFHLKNPSRNPHSLVTSTAAVLEQFKGRVLIVPGNHDLSQDNLDTIPSQPLGTLALSPKITLLMGHDEETDIHGIPYVDSFEEFHSRLKQVPDSTHLIATHASIFPKDDHPPYGHMNADEIVTEGIPLAYGHIHSPHGFYKGFDAWFCNNGAISRGSLHEETLNRELAVTLFDSESFKGCPFTSVPIPYKPASEVFRLAEHHEEQAKAEQLDDFLSTMQGVSLTSLSMEEVMAAGSGLDKSAQQELRDIVETVTG